MAARQWFTEVKRNASKQESKRKMRWQKYVADETHAAVNVWDDFLSICIILCWKCCKIAEGKKRDATAFQSWIPTRKSFFGIQKRSKFVSTTFPTIFKDISLHPFEWFTFYRSNAHAIIIQTANCSLSHYVPSNGKCVSQFLTQFFKPKPTAGINNNQSLSRWNRYDANEYFPPAISMFAAIQWHPFAFLSQTVF